MKPSRLVWLAALLLALQPVTTDLYLPGLPYLQAAVQAGPAEAQQTLTALLLAFGLSQLLWGELADRCGRRRVLLTGLLLHAGSALMCTLADSIGWVIVWRTLQGAALGSVIISARALIHEQAASGESIQTLGRSLTLVAIIATLTIPAGGLIVSWLHWKVSLLLPGLISLSLAGWVLFTMTEAKVPKADRKRLRWRQILQQPVFYRFTLLNGLSFATLVSLFSSSPFLYIHQQDYSPAQYGIAMCLIVSGFPAGTLLCRRLLDLHGFSHTLITGAMLSLLSVLISAALWVSGGVSLPLFVLPGFVFMLSHGIHHTCAQGRVLQPFPGQSATAAALNGCLMMVISFALNSAFGILQQADERVFLPLMLLALLCSLASFQAFLLPADSAVTDTKKPS